MHPSGPHRKVIPSLNELIGYLIITIHTKVSLREYLPLLFIIPLGIDLKFKIDDPLVDSHNKLILGFFF